MGVISIANSNDSDHILSLFSRRLDRRYQMRFYSNSVLPLAPARLHTLLPVSAYQATVQVETLADIVICGRLLMIKAAKFPVGVVTP